MVAHPNQHPRPLSSLVDDLQAQGRYTFVDEDVAGRAGRSAVGLEAALRRLRHHGRIVSPRRGFHVIVPTEYRAAACPPATWFIADLMRFLDQPYYVGLLSAAAIHGAAHQQPMVFQVMTDRPTRSVTAGRVRIEFHVSSAVRDAPTLDVQTETGTMRVATPEATALDLVRYPAPSGYLNNVATVLTELAEKLDAVKLAALAPSYAVPEAQRAGFLLDFVGYSQLADPLADWLKDRRCRAVALRPDVPAGDCTIDPRWRVIVNEVVEVDA